MGCIIGSTTEALELHSAPSGRGTAATQMVRGNDTNRERCGHWPSIAEGREYTFACRVKRKVVDCQSGNLQGHRSNWKQPGSEVPQQ